MNMIGPEASRRLPGISAILGRSSDGNRRLLPERERTRTEIIKPINQPSQISPKTKAMDSQATGKALHSKSSIILATKLNRQYF